VLQIVRMVGMVVREKLSTLTRNYQSVASPGLQPLGRCSCLFLCFYSGLCNGHENSPSPLTTFLKTMLCRRGSGDAEDSPVPFGLVKPSQPLGPGKPTFSLPGPAESLTPSAPVTSLFPRRFLLPPALVHEVDATVKRFFELRSCGSARSADGAITPTLGGREGSGLRPLCFSSVLGSRD
jgi:hypothetical protein